MHAGCRAVRAQSVTVWRRAGRATQSRDVSLFPLLVVGLLLGVRHATDADHVVAVAALVSREKRTSVISRLGAMWGAGHMLTVFIVGGAIVALGVVIPPRVALCSSSPSG